MKNSTAIVVLSACLGLFSSLPAYSNQNTPFDAKGHPLPFVNTPKGVQDYANSLDWGRRKKVNFFEVGTDKGCFMDRERAGSPNGPIWSPILICKGGYVEVSDPVETKVCELQSDGRGEYWGGLSYTIRNGEMKYNITERCSIK